MLRKLLSLLCAVMALNVTAQQANNTPTKTTEKKDDPQIDYKQIGAPMPPVRLFVYHDTSKNKSTQENAVKKDAPVAEEKHADKKKTKHKDGQRSMESKTVLTNKDLDIGANLFIMIFNPTCSHCEDETANIERSTDFKKSKLILIATAGMGPYLPDFFSLLHVDQYPFITVGLDSSGFLNNVYLYQALPQINIYNSEQKLLKIYTGEVAMDSLKKYIE